MVAEAAHACHTEGVGGEAVADGTSRAGAEGAAETTAAAGEGGVVVAVGGTVFDVVDAEDLEGFEEGGEGDLEEGRVDAVVGGEGV